MEDASTKLGRSPETLFKAACDPSLELRFISSIEDVIASTTLTEIKTILGGLGGGDSAPHEVFEISPGNHDVTRRFGGSRVVPISDWAMRLILQQDEFSNAQSIQKAFLLFTTILSGWSMARKLWELAVHHYFCHHDGNLTMKRLLRVDTTSSNLMHLDERILTMSNTKIHVCETDGEFKKKLWCHFREGKSCYLKLNPDTFGGISSILFRPGEPIIFFQLTIARQPTINIFGLERALLWMNPPDDWTNNIFREYHPEIRPWQIVLVVGNGVEQKYSQEQQLTDWSRKKSAELSKDIDKWRAHMEQYVMELKSADIFQALRQLN
jgi:hypothetical protein